MKKFCNSLLANLMRPRLFGPAQLLGLKNSG